MSQTTINPYQRIAAAKELMDIEVQRANGEEVNLSRLTNLYVALLDKSLLDALETLSNKDVCIILSLAANVELRVAQNAISYLKRQVKKCAK